MVLISVLADVAFGCGGLVCDAQQPVIQEGEKIIFGLDSETGTVETHVEISYSGPAASFGWIVPVFGEPEVFASPQALFDQLGPATSPLFTLQNVDEGRCRNSTRQLRFGVFELSLDDSAPAEPSPVDVLSRSEVGPYDATVLQAQSSEALRSFLDANHYAIPESLDPALAPYISQGAYFIAIRLQKDREVGDIAPLGFRYNAAKASIPIQLTAIAVADDMPLEVYVFGKARAVPESYLHVKINEAAIDWWSGGANYFDVVRRAADEAGGQAFATDYFGAPPELPQRIPDLGFLAEASGRLEWLVDLFEVAGWAIDNGTWPIIAELAGLPPSVSYAEYVECPECYWTELPATFFDAAAATETLVEEVQEPLQDVFSLFDEPYVTRLTSSLSAAEMTVDPVFVLNPDMSNEPVSNLRNATQVFECRPNRRRWKARRRLELADGRVIRMHSTDRIGGQELAFLEDQAAVAAKVIERTSASGEPEVLFDFSNELNALAQGGVGRGCAGWRGCTTTGPGALGVLGWFLVFATLRRRSLRG
ncbi:MAG: DUF2330 domain-containing protein [Myxococcota bacterium]